MNIFVLDSDPKVSAQYHCNKHVVKMILESAQMLCAAHWYALLSEAGKSLKDFKKVSDAKTFIKNSFSTDRLPPYSFTHVRHPCTIWTSERSGNYEWHLSLMRGLLDEYTLRYQKSHKSEPVWEWLRVNSPRSMPKTSDTSPHPICMPDDCKVTGDPVQSYRNYYRVHKRRFAKWEPRAKTPLWF